jgi:hypothetical protein
LRTVRVDRADRYHVRHPVHVRRHGNRSQ